MIETFSHERTAANISEGSIAQYAVIIDDSKGPTALWMTPQHHLIVVEEFGHRIKKYTTDGACVWTSGSCGAARGEFMYPTAVTIDAQEHIYITDRWNHRIQKCDEKGTCIATWGYFGDSADALCEPWGIALLPNGEVIVVDRGNGRLIIYSSEGAVRKCIEQRGTPIDFYEGEQFKGGFHFKQWLNNVSKLNTLENRFFTYRYDVGVMEYPESVSVDPEGNIFVTDRVSGHVVVFNSACEITELIKSPLGLPRFEPSFVFACGEGIFIAEEARGYLYWLRHGRWTVFDFTEYNQQVSSVWYDEHTHTAYLSDAWHNTVARCTIA